MNTALFVKKYDITVGTYIHLMIESKRKLCVYDK